MLALCTMVTFLRPAAIGVLESELEQPAAALARVHAAGHRDRVRVIADLDVVLVADVQPLEILAHHHQIDVVEAAARNERARRTQVRVQLELLAQAHVRGAIAAARGRLERSLEGEVRAADARDGARGQRDLPRPSRLPAPRSGGPTRTARRAHRARPPHSRRSRVRCRRPGSGWRESFVSSAVFGAGEAR